MTQNGLESSQVRGHPRLHVLPRGGLFIGLQGLTFALVLIHAVHVVGGLILLVVLATRAAVDRLSLEHLPAIRGVATYWHFLEGVWMAMVVLFFLLL